MSEHVITLAELELEEWASCGPAAAAALLHRPLAEVHEAFPAQTAEDTWTTTAQMLTALRTLGLNPKTTGYAGTTFPTGVHPTPERCSPRVGIAQVQFRGAWDKLPVNHPAQLHRSHFIAVTPLRNEVPPQTTMVFDINMAAEGINGGWVPLFYWENRVAPWLWETHQPRARRRGAWSLPAGAKCWWVRAGIEVLLPASEGAPR